MVMIFMQLNEVLELLEKEANPEYREKMTKFAINPILH